MKCVPLIAVAILAAAIATLNGSEHSIGSGQSAMGVGFIPQRVSRVEQLIQRHVDERALPGAVLLLARRGKVAARSLRHAG